MAKKAFRLAQRSRFFCTRCGKEGIPIPRMQGQERKAGHLKKLYCIYCREELNHAEIKEEGYTYQDFMEDFENGVFLNQQIYIK